MDNFEITIANLLRVLIRTQQWDKLCWALYR